MYSEKTLLNHFDFDSEKCFFRDFENFGKVTLRTTFSFRTPVAEIRYDLRVKKKKEIVRNETYSGIRGKL